AIPCPTPDRIRLWRVDMSVEFVRDPLFVIRSGTCCNKAEVAVHLHRVDVDNDAAELLSGLERQRRLATGGRSCNKHHLGCHHPALVAILIAPRRGELTRGYGGSLDAY